MVWARRDRLRVSAFVTYTDSETWAGKIHQAQALRHYRDRFVGNTKAVVAGMTSIGFTLADPKCLRTATTRHAGRGRFRHQRAGRHLGPCAGGVLTSRRSAGSGMPRHAGGGENLRPQFLINHEPYERTYEIQTRQNDKASFPFPAQTAVVGELY
jgi:hypothetical protein